MDVPEYFMKQYENNFENTNWVRIGQYYYGNPNADVEFDGWKNYVLNRLNVEYPGDIIYFIIKTYFSQNQIPYDKNSIYIFHYNKKLYLTNNPTRVVLYHFYDIFNSIYDEDKTLIYSKLNHNFIGNAVDYMIKWINQNWRIEIGYINIEFLNKITGKKFDDDNTVYQFDITKNDFYVPGNAILMTLYTNINKFNYKVQKEKISYIYQEKVFITNNIEDVIPYMNKYDLMNFVYYTKNDNMNINILKEYALNQVIVNKIEDIDLNALKNIIELKNEQGSYN